MTSAPPQQTPARRLAALLTAVFAPAHLVIVLLLVVGAASDPSAARGLGWGVLAALLVGVAPYGWVLLSVRQGRLASRHIPDRRQRLVPLAIAAGFAVAGAGLLAVLGAPRQVVALVVAMLVGLGVTGTITTRWKISIHAAVAAGTVTILAIVFGPALLATAAVVPATGWSRVTLRDHTPTQVIVGAVLGSLIAATVFVGFR